MRQIVLTFSGGLALFFSSTADAQLTLSTGIEYTRGNYGKPEPTEVWSVGLAARYRTGPWTFRISLPLLRVDGPSSVTDMEASDPDDGDYIDPADDDEDETGGGSSGTTGNTARRQTGFGDATISVFRTVVKATSGPVGIELGGMAKVPVADGNCCLLTNDEMDFSAQVNLFQYYGRFEPYLSFGWTRRGDPVARDNQCNVIDGSRIDLHDPIFRTIGVGYRLDRDSSIRIEHEFRQKLRTTSAPKSELSVIYQKWLTEHWRLNAFGLIGLSNNSPDLGLGASVSYRNW
ncbi:MAG: hypothetical protein ACKVP2_05920 [Burkholderiales bacterium]